LHWLRAAIPLQPKPSHPAQVLLIAIDEATYGAPPFAGMPTVMWTPQLARVMNAVLDAGLRARDEDRREVCTRRVNPCGVAGRSRADNKNFAMMVLWYFG
jgi:hypothetical protein